MFKYRNLSFLTHLNDQPRPRQVLRNKRSVDDTVKV